VNLTKSFEKDNYIDLERFKVKICVIYLKGFENENESIWR